MVVRMIQLLWMIMILIVCGLPIQVVAQDQAQEPLTELFLFEEMPSVVTATGFAQNIQEAPNVISVITQAEIKNSGAQTLIDVVKNVSGLGTYISHYGQYEIEIRGIKTDSSEKIKIMVNGVPINEPFFGGGLIFWDDIPVQNIERVEIIRGPGSALYGSDAFVGTINIITKEPGTVKGVQVAARGGSYQTYGAHALAGGDLNSLEIVAYMDWLDTKGPAQTVEQDSQYGTPWTQSPGKTKMAESRYDLELRMAYRDINVDLRYAQKKRQAYIGLLGAINDDSELKESGLFGKVYYDWSLTDKTHIISKLFYNRFDEDIFWEVFPKGAFSAFPEGLIIDLTAATQNIGMDIQLVHQIAEYNRLLVGIQYERKMLLNVTHLTNSHPITGAPLGEITDFTDTLNWIKPDAARAIYATWIQDEWNFQDLGLGITLGVRYDNYSDFGDTVNPRLGIVQQVFGPACIKMLYGTAFRAPNFRELYDQNNPNTKGNPNLKPEKINSYEVSLETPLVQRSGLGRINFFYNEIKDIIGVDATGSAPYAFANLEGIYARGVELELKYPIETGWTWNEDGIVIYTNASYQHSRKAGTALDVYNVPEKRGNVGANIGFLKYFNVNGNVLYRDKISTGRQNDIPAVLLTDVTLRIQELVSHTEFKITVTNLTDQDYKDPAEWSGVTSNLPRAGRTFLATAEYQF